eukprot:76197-Prymnesium_polylepis.1
MVVATTPRPLHHLHSRREAFEADVLEAVQAAERTAHSNKPAQPFPRLHAECRPCHSPSA